MTRFQYPAGHNLAHTQMRPNGTRLAPDETGVGSLIERQAEYGAPKHKQSFPLFPTSRAISQKRKKWLFFKVARDPMGTMGTI